MNTGNSGTESTTIVKLAIGSAYTYEEYLPGLILLTKPGLTSTKEIKDESFFKGSPESIENGIFAIGTQRQGGTLVDGHVFPNVLADIKKSSEPDISYPDWSEEDTTITVRAGTFKVKKYSYYGAYKGRKDMYYIWYFADASFQNSKGAMLIKFEAKDLSQQNKDYYARYKELISLK